MAKIINMVFLSSPPNIFISHYSSNSFSALIALAVNYSDIAYSRELSTITVGMGGGEG